MNRRRRSLLLVLGLLVLLPAGARAGTVDLATSGSPRIDGPAAGGGFGTAALATGDVNGDGAVDVVIGAPDALQGRGAVYCMLGTPGQLPAARNLAISPADLTITGPAPGSHLGVAAVVADLDGDGVGELAVSTGGYVPSYGRLASGGVLIFRGGAALTARRQIDLSVEHADASVVDSTIPVAIGASLAVGDFAFQEKCFDKISELKRQGVCTLFVSHKEQDVLRVADRCLWLSQGQIIAQGSPADIMAQYNQGVAAPKEEL